RPRRSPASEVCQGAGRSPHRRSDLELLPRRAGWERSPARPPARASTGSTIARHHAPISADRSTTAVVETASPKPCSAEERLVGRRAQAPLLAQAVQQAEGADDQSEPADDAV